MGVLHALKIAAVLLLAAASPAAFAKQVNGLFRSSDGGKSWTLSGKGLSGEVRINAFAIADGGILAATNSGILISKDQGLSWRATKGVPASTGRLISIAGSSLRAFAGTDGDGLLGSSDGGRSWAPVTSFPAKKVRCLVIHQGVVFAGTDTQGVFASEDLGKSWNQMTSGLPSHSQVFAMSMVGNKLFAGLYSRGLFTWDEAAKHWLQVGSVKPLALANIGDTLLAGHNPGGIHWSADSGASWVPGRASVVGIDAASLLIPAGQGEWSANIPVWEMGAAEGSNAIAGAGEGIYYSEDKGRQWHRAREGLPEASPGIAFLVRPGFILAAVLVESNEGEFRDVDVEK